MISSRSPSSTPKSYLAYDEHVIIQDGQRKYFAGGGVPWNQIIVDKQGHFVLSVDSTTVDENGYVLLAGAGNAENYELATKLCKKIARSLIVRLREVELDGGCIEDLTADRVVIYPTGEVRFREIRVLTIQNSNLTADGIIARLRTNHQSGEALIRTLFWDDQSHRIPGDMRHLLDLMTNEFDYRDMFPIHPSLLPLTSYPSMIKKLYDLAVFMIPRADYFQICDALHPQIGLWRMTARSNRLLKRTLDYDGGRPYSLPNLTSNTPIGPDHIAAFKLIELPVPTTANPVITLFHRRVLAVNKFWVFQWHRLAHRMEALPAIIGQHQAHLFAALSSEVTTRVKFPRELSLLMYQLRRLGHLQKLDLDVLFT